MRVVYPMIENRRSFENGLEELLNAHFVEWGGYTLHPGPCLRTTASRAIRSAVGRVRGRPIPCSRASVPAAGESEWTFRLPYHRIRNAFLAALHELTPDATGDPPACLKYTYIADEFALAKDGVQGAGLQMESTILQVC